LFPFPSLVLCQDDIDGYGTDGGVHLFVGGLHLNQGRHPMEATVKVDSTNYIRLSQDSTCLRRLL
jgi:hypothetical protein